MKVTAVMSELLCVPLSLSSRPVAMAYLIVVRTASMWVSNSAGQMALSLPDNRRGYPFWSPFVLVSILGASPTMSS